MIQDISNSGTIKWSYTTRIIPDRPLDAADLPGCLRWSEDPPRANDVIVAEIIELGRHKRMGLASRRRGKLFPGDLVGVAYGNRYATRQFEGVVSASLGPCHLLGGGGVCGDVIGMASTMQPPTTLRPLGFLARNGSDRVNLRQWGLRPVKTAGPSPTVILVVGSAMDSGKTTVAYSLVHGLVHLGARVCAGKLTGTAASKDLLLMEDAGAARVLDFCDVGYAATAECSRDQLGNIAATIRSQLSSVNPDYIILEIADGVIQRETDMLLDLNRTERYFDHAVYACNDSLSVSSGVDILRRFDIDVVAVSGWVGCSQLSVREAQRMTDLPVLRPDELSEPGTMAGLLGCSQPPYAQETVTVTERAAAAIDFAPSQPSEG